MTHMAQRKTVGLKRYRRGGVWRWNVKASNGRLLCNGGQGFSRLIDMERSIQLTCAYLKASLDKK